MAESCGLPYFGKEPVSPANIFTCMCTMFHIFVAGFHKFRCVHAMVNLAYRVLQYHVQVINKRFFWFFQCVKEAWKDKLQEQKNEGCAVTGHLEVNKVCLEKISCLDLYCFNLQNRSFNCNCIRRSGTQA